MKKQLLVNTLLFSSTVILAQPSITNVIGTVVQGQSITITGSSFGANGPNIVVFDDFEKGTLGDTILTGLGSAQVGQWTSVWGFTYPRYTNISSVSGSLAFRGDMTNGYQSFAECQFPDTTRKVFISWSIYIPIGTNIPGEGASGINWKNVWLMGNGTTDDDLTLPTFLGGGYISACNDCPYYRYLNIDFNKGQWKHLWAWVNGGYANDGQVHLWELTNSGVIQRINDNNVSVLYQGGEYERIGINTYGAQASNCFPMFDDVYVATGDNARARIEVGNAPTYVNSTNLAVFTPTSWNNTSITATVRQGSFNDCDTVYIYVTDANGMVNQNGYKVIINPATCTGTSIADNYNAINNFSAYPNPSNGSFRISFIQPISTDILLEVVNMLGEKVYSEQLNNFSGKYEKEISLNNCAKGIYTLQLKSKENKISKKIIKE